MALIDGAWNTGSFVGHLLFNYTPKRAWSRTVESNHRGATTNRTCKPLRPAYHANNEIKRAAMYVTIASAAG